MIEMWVAGTLQSKWAFESAGRSLEWHSEAGGSNPQRPLYSLESDCSRFLSSLALYAISALGMMNSA